MRIYANIFSSISGIAPEEALELQSQSDVDDDDSEGENTANMDDTEEKTEEERGLDELEEEEYRMKILELKETKFIKQRLPFRYHRYDMTGYQKSKLAMKIYLGFRGK